MVNARFAGRFLVAAIVLIGAIGAVQSNAHADGFSATCDYFDPFYGVGWGTWTLSNYSHNIFGVIDGSGTWWSEDMYVDELLETWSVSGKFEGTVHNLIGGGVGVKGDFNASGYSDANGDPHGSVGYWGEWWEGSTGTPGWTGGTLPYDTANF